MGKTVLIYPESVDKNIKIRCGRKSQGVSLFDKCPDSILWVIDNNDISLSCGIINKISFCCPKCKSKFQMRVGHFANGSRCPYCTGIRVNETNWAYSNIEMLKTSKSKEILKTVTPSSNKTNIWICDTCHSEYNSLFNDFNKGRRCPYCRGLQVNETNWAYSNKEMYDASVDKEILKTTTVSSNKKKNIWFCPQCDYEYVSTFNKFSSGHRCPRCKESKGERYIIKKLDELGICHQRQYKFSDCKNINCLPFDHAIFSNDILQGVIEFQGRQHFEQIKFWGGEDALKSTIFRDKIKSDYCKINNIPLLIIPYTEIMNIEIILCEWLKQTLKVL